jgi:hypothetical protein
MDGCQAERYKTELDAARALLVERTRDRDVMRDIAHDLRADLCLFVNAVGEYVTNPTDESLERLRRKWREHVDRNRNTGG